MASKQVTVLARARAKEGMEERLKQELLALVAPSRSEAGCINYNLHQGAEDKTLFMFYENWVSKDDLDKHFEMPYLTSIDAKVEHLLAEPIEITLWEIIA